MIRRTLICLIALAPLFVATPAIAAPSAEGADPVAAGAARSAAAVQSAAALATAARWAPAQAQADPALQVVVHGGLVGIRTSSTARPRVRLLAADGTLRIAVTASGNRPADGLWVVELTNQGAGEPPVLIRPGDEVEVTIGASTTRVTVPEMQAEADVGLDVVRGTVPPTAAVGLWLHRDQIWFGPLPDPEGVVVPVAPDGRFEHDLSGTFDVRPGTWGEVAMQIDAHIFLVQFAPPSVTVNLVEHYALVRANPTDQPRLVLRDHLGFDYFLSAPAIAYGGPTFAVLLADPVDFTLYEPAAGDELALLLGGAEAVVEPVPWTTASVDRAARSVWGVAAPDARVVVSVLPDAGASQDAVRTVIAAAGPEGAYEVPFAELELAATARAGMQGWGGGAVAYTTAGLVPAQAIDMHGDSVTGIIGGWGAVTVEHRDPEGSLVARTTAQASPVGEITASLRRLAGGPDALAPGDRIVLTPQAGRALTIEVPKLTAWVDASRSTLRGQAPPDAPLLAAIYDEMPDLFDPTLPDGDPITRTGRSDGQGAYELRCGDEGCMRFGTLTTAAGTTTYRLHWVDAPYVGVNVTSAFVVGRATAGTAVGIAPTAPDGTSGGARALTVRAPSSGALPSWQSDLTDWRPAGLVEGDALRIEVGDVVFPLTVPAFSWQADTFTDTVTGTGPPAQTVYIFASSSVPENDPRPFPYASTATVVAATGRWSARFQGFDLRPGDNLDLFLAAESWRMWWTEIGIEGDEPTPPPTRVPTREPTPPPARPTIYLPHAARG